MPERTLRAAVEGAPTPGRTELALRWLLRLRWGAIALAACAIGAAGGILRLELPFGRLLGLVGLAAVTNALAPLASRRLPPTRLAGGLLVLDVAALTAMLQLTGGPMNPFGAVYLVYIALAAVVLGSGWTWFLTGLSALGYGLLFLSGPAAVQAHLHAGPEVAAHLQGMWWALLAAGVLTAAFVSRLARELELREAEVVAARERASRYERLASLSTLAAGAAHELSTPLGTIALAAGELERALSGEAAAGPAQVEDVRLIRAEVARCRRVLDQMAADSGDAAGEAPARVRTVTLLDAAVRALPAALAARVERGEVADVELEVPRETLTRTLTSLLRNACDASAEPARPVVVSARDQGSVVRLEVRDEGSGMSAEVLARAGEPFFTTKPPGSGMGLGLFLARTLAEQLGGRLVLQSMPGEGTRAGLELPLAARSRP